MRVFVVGNIVMDQTLAVDRMPREGESILGSKVSADLGGKGTNQAIVLARCGVPAVLIAGIGDDVQGEQMRKLLAQELVDARLVVRAHNASDSSIVLKDAQGGNVNITTVDCARGIETTDVIPLLKDAMRGDLLVMQGNLRFEVTADLINFGREKGLGVVLNPSPFDPQFAAVLTGLDILFLNEHEAEQLTGLRDEAAVAQLLKRGVGTVVLTLGARGALLGSGTCIDAVPAQPCVVVDSTGAGDTFQSVAIGSALLRTGAIDLEALATAARAAAITVSRFGTKAAFPKADEIRGLNQQSQTVDEP
jgi:ribokinase